ncbi:winged helix-turn-helix domain-containing protein [Bradyrhizobium sp. Arg68]|uniref:winged helix-turn-helix domain-containing protein n=1 Tax=Bradyrhizobium ivorense TaxID=2511166 RepID=UPI001E31003B|nr:winged helix-turn-helix domain-containing protein [Bradyrhizobium ivorense]MCC8938694.1 winged helix-turn-helix domain-containing protein [Bradyrhizobium ivorense]
MRYLFENYAFDTDRRELHRGAEVVAIAPKVFDLLDFLIRNRERVVSKDDLINAIWDGRSVSDEALTTRLNAARSAIGDSGQEQRLIKTLPRKGFRFVGAVLQAQGRTGAPLADDGPIEHPRPVLALPDKPSIAVLPFQNLSDDPEQEYFADGMVEDIITGLSRSKLLFVISRNSSFTYKGEAIDIKRISRELGVRYVLEGSVRKAGKRIRVTGQLIDASTNAHIWADKFDSDLDDIFDLQDRLTSSVIGAMSPQLERAEIERARRKPTENLQAYDYYLRSKFSIYQWTREGSGEALRMTRLAISLDPAFAVAYASGANIFGQKKGFGWIEDAAKERAESRQLVERAVQLDQDDPLVLAHAAHVYSYMLEEPETGSALAARAIALDPNLAMARLWAGWSQLYLGNHDAAIEQFSAAIRLSPIDPHLFIPQTGMAFAHFFGGRYDEGLSLATSAIQRQPNFLGAQRILMSSLAMAGRIAEARRACDAVLQTDPALRISGIKSSPFRRLEDVEKLGQAWRIAGVPE